MNVGLIDLLGGRLTRYWQPYLTALGLEVALPQLPPDAAYALGRQTLAEAPAWVQLALGRILELERSDLLLLPDLNAFPEDAWTGALPEALARRVSSLPALHGVPTEGPDAEAAAAELGQRLIHNPGKVRLALERSRPLAASPRATAVQWSVTGKRTVGIVGPATLTLDTFLSAPLRSALDAAGLHPVWAHELPESEVAQRAERVGTRSEAEAELVGAVGALSAKGSVAGLIFAASVRDPLVTRLTGQLAAKAFKPAILQEIDPEAVTDLIPFAERLDLSGRARSAGGTP